MSRRSPGRKVGSQPGLVALDLQLAAIRMLWPFIPHESGNSSRLLVDDDVLVAVLACRWMAQSGISDFSTHATQYISSEGPIITRIFGPTFTQAVLKADKLSIKVPGRTLRKARALIVKGLVSDMP